MDRESGSAVTTDRDGRVTLVGRFAGTLDLGGEPLSTQAHASDTQLFDASFEPDGTHRWSRTTVPADDWGHVIPVSVASDAADNTLVSGIFSGAIDLGGGPLRSTPVPTMDGFVVKLAPDGSHLWSVRIGDTGSDAVIARFDSNGDVALSGTFEGASTSAVARCTVKGARRGGWQDGRRWSAPVEQAVRYPGG